MAPEQKITPIYLTLSQYLIVIRSQDSSNTQYSTLSDIKDIYCLTIFAGHVYESIQGSFSLAYMIHWPTHEA